MKARAFEAELDICRAVIAAGALTVSPEYPYMWSSGLRAPLYCDHRRLLAYPQLRRRVTRQLEAIALGFRETDAIAAVAVAAIPYASWVAEHLMMPLLVVRALHKGHGLGRQVEGDSSACSKVAVIEDVVSSGASAHAAAAALAHAGLSVTGVATILDYQLGGTFEFNVEALYTFAALRVVLGEQAGLAKEVTAIDEWHRDPWRWGRAREVRVSAEIHHARSAGGVVTNPRGEVLVVNQHDATWSLPKGHIETGEDALSAAVREVAEESGVEQLECLGLLGVYTRLTGEPPHREAKTITMFRFETPQLSLGPRDPAITLARWVPPVCVCDLLSHPADRAFFDRIRKSVQER